MVNLEKPSASIGWSTHHKPTLAPRIGGLGQKIGPKTPTSLFSKRFFND